ncbi:MAG: hypothetical protein HY647_12755, partial [Acidobacteria bacterium]|nr:hypothetical protein [Acidobacteriota bacterium]
MKRVRNCNRRHLLSLLIVWVALAKGIGHGLQAQPAGLPPEVVAYADIVLYNGQILTVDEDFSTAEAVAIRDGKFLAVGRTDRILAMAGPKTQKIDLKGKTAVPGIIDTHMH